MSSTFEAQSLQSRLIKGLSQLVDKKVLVIGDVMLDRYLMGSVDRISPEAPVPIVAISEERAHLGGAGNVAKNIMSLGGCPWLLGVTGEDSSAAMLMELVGQEGIKASFIKDSLRPTTTKTRIIAQQQQVLRIDYEKLHELGLPVHEQLLLAFRDALPHADIVIFSDYGKGVFNKPFTERAQALIQEAKSNMRILVDPKPHNASLFKNCYLLTPNIKEAAQCLGVKAPETRDDIITVGRGVMGKFPSQNLLITLGAKGMALFEANGAITHMPTHAQQVFDVTGAGDTVIATVGLSLAAGLSLRDACHLANFAAGYVVGELGAASATYPILNDILHRCPSPSFSEWEAAR
jgi:rfaE bifunctional protein kinase chain/domain